MELDESEDPETPSLVEARRMSGLPDCEYSRMPAVVQPSVSRP